MTTIKFDKKLECGPEYVAVRIIENCEELKVGNIWLTANANANDRLAHAQIESVGSKAAEEYGLAIGDYVMIDRLATYAHTAPIAALKYNNVICKTDKDQTDYFPLKGMLFVEPDEKDDVSVVGGIAVQNYAEKLRTGTITKQNCQGVELPFKEGDKVLLSKGADRVEIKDKTLYIYKYDMVIATIKD